MSPWIVESGWKIERFDVVKSDVKVGSEAINMGFKARSYIEEIIITIHTNYLNYQGQVK